MTYIYELMDVTDDECQYPLGLFLELPDVLKALAGIRYPAEIGVWNDDGDFCHLEVWKRYIGWPFQDGKLVYQIEFTERYDEDRDEYMTDRRDWT